MAKEGTPTVSFVRLTEDDVPGAKFSYETAAEHSNIQLKRWLACRGLKSSGNRSELVARCNDCIASGRSVDIDITIDGGKWYQKKAGILVERSANKPIPPVTGWKPLVATSLPAQYNYGNVYHWLVESMPSLPGDTDNQSVVTGKPLVRGQQYVQSGNVGCVETKVSDSIFHVKAKVLPSMRNENPYTVTIALSVVSGTVLDATCHCKSSALSRCSHIAAVLLSLCDSADRGASDPACTDLPCQWHRGSKRKMPDSINKKVYNSKRKQTNVIAFDPRPAGTIITVEAKNKFLTDLGKADTICMWQTTLQFTYIDYDLSRERNELLSCMAVHILNNLRPSVDEEAALMPNTSNQSASTEWHNQRSVRMTASSAKEAVMLWRKESVDQSSVVSESSLKFVQRKVWGLHQVVTRYMQEGLEKEEQARMDYFAYMKQQSPLVEVQPTGLWVNVVEPCLACSPDGIVNDPSENPSVGCVEIKVLKIFSHRSPVELKSAVERGEMKKEMSSQCFKVNNGNFTLKRSHGYYYQVQFQLGVTGLSWCDFVMWSPVGEPAVERVYRDDVFIAEIMSANKKYWKAVIAPELVEMRAPRNLKPFKLKG
ncbi:uncharacterized protein LOC106180092 [Lingula anatina]|uniref:Uncharacterized protein LOC106180092 n=1 Tax=Lingula anatina TaxID=7574 RepID=A0A1S3KAA9_LINAN|nr:uncharacterized protein LOC106180092 [Lingula anatina]|eukprot:XP_013419437.1 uncharacterized protein LOC106180092 [Lingula anatina]